MNIKTIGCATLLASSLAICASGEIPKILNQQYLESVQQSSMHSLKAEPLLQLQKNSKYVTMVTWTNQKYNNGDQIVNDSLWVT